MQPLSIIGRYYREDSLAYRFLVPHSRMVTHKALAVAGRIMHLRPDLRFIAEAGMLHDIGIVQTDAPQMGCHGRHPYIMHGVLGREMLEAEGLPRHALVCERHVGVGLPLSEIERQDLPLPRRDMLPVSLEEEIICFADKFYSKDPGKVREEKSVGFIREQLSRFGEWPVQRFDAWCGKFREPL